MAENKGELHDPGLGVRVKVTVGGVQYKEFTGQRDDPFYVDVGSIFDLGGLRPFNALHLVPLPTAPGIDSLKGYNTHITAIQVPITTPAAVTATHNKPASATA